MPQRHHHQPQTIQHKKHNCGNQVLRDRDSLEGTPYNAADDRQVKKDVDYKDLSA